VLFAPEKLKCSQMDDSSFFIEPFYVISNLALIHCYHQAVIHVQYPVEFVSSNVNIDTDKDDFYPSIPHSHNDFLEKRNSICDFPFCNANRGKDFFKYQGFHLWQYFTSEKEKVKEYKNRAFSSVRLIL